MRTTLLAILTLTLFGAAHAQPTSTPLIAFVEAGNLYTWENGTRHALVENGAVKRVWLNADGTRVAFTQTDGRVQKPGYDHIDIADWQYESTSLWVVDVDGANLRQLVDLDHYRGGIDYGDSIFILDLVWVPGTSLIVFNTYTVSEVASFASQSHARIYALNTETGDVSLRHDTDEPGRFSVSPDGVHAVSMTETRISYFPLSGIGDGDGGVPEAVTLYTYERSAHTYQSFYYPAVHWAADGESLLAVDLTSEVGWPETDDDGNPVNPSIDVVHIHTDGTTDVLASTQREDLNYWTLRFAADGSSAVYSTAREPDCGFASLPLETEILLAPQRSNTVMCSGREAYAFIASTPGGATYRLDQRAEYSPTENPPQLRLDGVASLSRACDDFSACDTVWQLDETVRSLDFIDETRYIYRAVREAGTSVLTESHALFYAELGGEPQPIGVLARTFPDDVFSVSVNRLTR